ncbi:jg20898 [Pararge aegeria aegeria]|uniref:Jg20898 protein n=1 Tax=Pararge aegeria aegeria TaxID=348720 RepID=A0A8S4RJ61_9NEOP|nr:jg20898 [Pararge aegeria aegeria]
MTDDDDMMSKSKSKSVSLDKMRSGDKWYGLRCAFVGAEFESQHAPQKLSYVRFEQLNMTCFNKGEGEETSMFSIMFSKACGGHHYGPNSSHCSR